MPETKPSLQLELQELLLVGVGAVPGALLRWQLALHLGDQNLLVNVLGAALLGLLAGLPAAPRRQLLLGIGFCGSLTTFSSWMLAAMKHLSSGDWAAALGLIGLTLGLGVGAAALGVQPGATAQAASAASIADLRSSGVTPLLKRAITVPSLPTRNFSKFHSTSPAGSIWLRVV